MGVVPVLVPALREQLSEGSRPAGLDLGALASVHHLWAATTTPTRQQGNKATTTPTRQQGNNNVTIRQQQGNKACGVVDVVGVVNNKATRQQQGQQQRNKATTS